MIRKLLLQSCRILSILLFTSVCYGQKKISIKTDPRVEALSIFFTLATADTLDTKPTPSVYYQEVKAYFKPYNDHPSLNWYRKLANWDGPDMASLGLFLSETYPFKLERKPEIDYVRNSEMDTFICRFNAFYKDCRVAKFLTKQHSQYEKIDKRAERYLEKNGILHTVDSFYKSKQKLEYLIYTDFLCNHGSNAIKSGDEKFAGKFIIKAGYIEDKAKQLNMSSPVNFEPAPNVIAHECSHIYLKNFLKNYHDRLFAIRTIFLTTATGKALADKQWENEVDELLVRVCVAKILAQRYGKESGDIEIANQAKHFKLATALYSFMDTYTQNTSRYHMIEEFYPELILFLENKARL